MKHTYSTLDRGTFQPAISPKESSDSGHGVAKTIGDTIGFTWGSPSLICVFNIFFREYLHAIG